MSSLITDLADKLATRVIAHVDATGDPDMERVITQTLGDSSQSLQEAFIVSLRAQRAAIRANALLDGAQSAPDTAPAPPPEPEPEPEPADTAAAETEPDTTPDPAPKKTKPSGKKKNVGPWDLEG